jgi:malate synthase
MAAQIPVKGDSAANDEAFAKVRIDKEREAGDGHDGTWVAHPGLVPVAMEVFDRLMPAANHLDRPLDDDPIGADDLLAVPEGTITEAGVRNNVAAALRYLAAWLGGRGAVPINNLMEDAATAEIARAQLWQWIRYPDGRLEDGRDITAELFRQVLRDELDAAATETTDDRHRVHLHSAAKLLAEVVEDAQFVPFITLPAYDLLD